MRTTKLRKAPQPGGDAEAWDYPIAITGESLFPRKIDFLQMMLPWLLLKADAIRLSAVTPQASPASW